MASYDLKYQGVQTFDMNRERLAEHIDKLNAREPLALRLSKAYKRRWGKVPK